MSMSMTNNSARTRMMFGSYAVESFDSYCNNNNNNNDNQEEVMPGLTNLSPASSASLVSTDDDNDYSPSATTATTPPSVGKSRSIFASYWSSPNAKPKPTAILPSSSSSQDVLRATHASPKNLRLSNNNINNKSQVHGQKHHDEDVMARLQSLHLPLVDVDDDAVSKSTHRYDPTTMILPSRLPPPPPVVVPHTTPQPTTVQDVQQVKSSEKQPQQQLQQQQQQLQSPKPRRQILPSPPPSPHVEQSPQRQPQQQESVPSSPVCQRPNNLPPYSPPCYSPYSPLSLREKAMMMTRNNNNSNNNGSSSNSGGGGRPWSSTSALIKKPSQSCLRRPRYSSFSCVEDTMKKSSGGCGRKPRSRSDADVLLLHADKDHQDKEKDIIQDDDDDNDGGKTDHDDEEEGDASTTTRPRSRSSSELIKKQVSFYSQVSVFEFTVVKHHTGENNGAMDGWSKYFGL